MYKLSYLATGYTRSRVAVSFFSFCSLCLRPQSANPDIQFGGGYWPDAQSKGKGGDRDRRQKRQADSSSAPRELRYFYLLATRRNFLLFSTCFGLVQFFFGGIYLTPATTKTFVFKAHT